MAEQIGKYTKVRGKRIVKKQARKQARAATKRALEAGKEPPERVISGWED